MRPVRAFLAVLALLGAAGCADDFLPPSYLNDLRVLSLVADPLELAPGQSVTIRPTVYAPPGSALASRRWTFCPLTAGSVAAYACAVPECEVDLPFDAATGNVTANPTALIAACLPAAGGVPAQLPEVIQTLFRFRVASDQGQERDAVLQIPQWTRGPPASPNLPPVILGVEIGGVDAATGPIPPLVNGGVLPVRLLIDPASVQTYVDAAGVSRQESMTGDFFATGGRFSANLTSGLDTTVNLEGTDLVAGQLEIDVWVLALDLRGGQQLVGPFRVPVQP
jgi:hypothetical protein